jgi:hypothetical protein
MLDAAEVSAIVNASMSKSDKIRALNRGGLPRARIADALRVKYQFVRNVLEADRVREEQLSVAEAAAPDLRPPARPPEPSRIGNLYRMPIGPGGVVTLPPDVLEAFGLAEGGVAVADLEGDMFMIISPRESVRRIRSVIPQWRPGEPLWSEALIADRRREAAEDESDG